MNESHENTTQSLPNLLAADILGYLTLILLVAVIPVSAQSSPPARSNDLVEVTRSIDTLIETEVAKQHLPGVSVVVVKDGKVAFQKGYGFANLEKQTKVDPERTVFRIGSISKVLTTTAIVQLASRGKIRLDDDVNKYLSGIKIDNRYPEPVRFRHLLDHTAGFDQIGLRRQVENPSARPGLEEFLKNELIRIRPPGLAVCYDTYGITLAGHLIERVSGRKYSEYLRENIFTPLGMSSTGVEIAATEKTNAAVGYGYKDGKYVPQRYEVYVTTPASSIDATAADMAKFMNAILAEESPILSKTATIALKQSASRTHPRIPGFSNGFWEDEINGQRVLHHGGTMLGFTSEMFLVPVHRLGFYIVYNRDQEAGGGNANLRDLVTKKLIDGLFSGEAESVAAKTPLPIPTERFVGNFANNLYCHTCYENEGWGMFYMPVKAAGPGVLDIDGVRWVAVEPDVFQSTATGTKMGFIANSKGRIIRAVTRNRVMDKLGDDLLEEVLGKDWRRDLSSPLIAQVYRANEEWENAAKAYQAIATKRPKDAFARFNAGRNWLRARKPDEAIKWFNEAWALNVRREFVAFGLASSYALKKEKDATLEWIKKALEAGFDEKDVFRQDPNFAFLLNDQRFVDLMKK